MKFIILLFLLLSLYFIVINSQRGVYPDSGLLVSLNSKFLSNHGNQFSKTFQQSINSFKVPNQSGKTGKISYTISNIQHSVELNGFTYSQTGLGEYNIAWDSITFTITADYNGCYKINEDSQLSFCEHGDVEIKTTSPVELVTSIKLNFDQTTPSIVCSGSTITPGSSISYSAHCTSKVCAKTGDIRNAIANEFVPKVESAITTEINKESSKFLPLFPTLRDLNIKLANGDQFYLNSKGSLIEAQTSEFMTLALQGGIVLKQTNGQFIYPIQTPTSLTSHKELEVFDTDVALTLTSFFFESLVDAGLKSKLPMTITPAQVPSSSPVTLNTSDPFFSQTAPGLTEKYPNKPISVQINYPTTPISVSLNSTGALLILELPFDFIVEDVNVFSIQFQFFIEITPALKQESSNSISVTGTIDKCLPFAKVISSEVGDVDTIGFIQLIQLLEGLIKLPTMTIQNPSTKFTLSNISFSNNDQFLQILLNLNQVSNNDKKINLI